MSKSIKKYEYDYPENRIIAQKLPRGASEIISNKTGLSRRQVQRVLKGKSQNKKVVELATVIIELHQTNIQQLELIS